MFGDGSSPELRQARRERQASILDSVTASLKDLHASGVPHGPRAPRAVYGRRSRDRASARHRGARRPPRVPSDVKVPYGVPESFHEHIQIQLDLLALAFQADITRVGTVLYARDLSRGACIHESGTDISFHGGSHHAEDPGRASRSSRRSTSITCRCSRVPGEKALRHQGRRRYPARSLADPVRVEHGQLEPAPALRRAVMCWSVECPGRLKGDQAISRCHEHAPCRPATCC